MSIGLVFAGDIGKALGKKIRVTVLIYANVFSNDSCQLYRSRIILCASIAHWHSVLSYFRKFKMDSKKNVPFTKEI